MTRSPALDAWRRRGFPPPYDALRSAAAWELAAILHQKEFPHSPSGRVETCRTRAEEALATDPVALLDVIREERRTSPAIISKRMGAVRPWKVARP